LTPLNRDQNSETLRIFITRCRWTLFVRCL